MTNATPEPGLNVEVEAKSRIEKLDARWQYYMVDEGLPVGHRYHVSPETVLALIQQVSDQRVQEVLEGIKNEMHSISVEEDDFTWFEPDVFNIIDQTLADYLSHKETK